MSRRTDAYDRMLEDATTAAPGLRAAIQLLMDSRPGLPGAQSFDGPNVTGGTSSSPTERHALNDDRTAATIRDLDHRLRRMEADALWFRRFVQANTPHAPTARDQADVEATNRDGHHALCEHCTPWVRHEHEPVHRTGDVAGNLPTSMALGRWCYDFVRNTGALPTEQQVRRHDEGRLVRVKA